MGQKIYETPDDALCATDRFYESQEGFQYTEELVRNWLTRYVNLPETGRVLDLCCGDGIWAYGMKCLKPRLELFGIDVSSGGIDKARTLMAQSGDAGNFIVGDVEEKLPYPDAFFDLIFARGPGLYNQHEMDRPETVDVIEHWHTKLSTRGRFYSIFASTPLQMGTYTAMENVKLPYNRCPRKSNAVDFKGGKFHHTIQSFLAPFWRAESVDVVEYFFIKNNHVLVTKKRECE